MSVLCRSLIYQLPLILWTTTCCYDSSIGSACVTECSCSGSIHICQAGHSTPFIVYIMCFVPQGTMACHFMFMLMTQKYLHFCHKEIVSSVNELEHCILNISHWMSTNRLKLNANKTKLLFASSSHSCSAVPAEWQVSVTLARSQHYHWLLGTDISSDLSLDYHVSRICMGCYYRLCKLWHIQWLLDSDSFATLVYAVVNSLIDYCNTVLAGSPRTEWTSYSVC